MPRVCAVTGSRADYGLMVWPMRALRDAPDFILQVAVTGMHLAPQFGNTWRDIEADGFAVDARVDMLLSGDTPQAVTKSVGLGVIGFADAFARLAPDFVLLLGDRYETLAAAQAAFLQGIPVMHLCGGDLTEGVVDESIRHAITKLSHLHGVTNADAVRRLRQLGENPARIHLTGSPGLDGCRAFQPLPRASFLAELGLNEVRRLFLVTYHPVTLGDGDAAAGDELLAVLDALPAEDGVILTGANADAGGQAINARLQDFAGRRANTVFRMSLGHRLYFNALSHCAAVIGNSSSGLYEAPSFAKPTVNIGDRQKGRLRAASVIDCPAERGAIRAALERGLALDLGTVVNPYGDGRTAPRILQVLREAPARAVLLRKDFHDL
jgi:UDP-N-acetylglucosamine 2-epimerase (non-hydrolysing)/GDP/UDP-N,N'-diacetylbacillosamine 2-epimerase (hydrolysing)